MSYEAYGPGLYFAAAAAAVFGAIMGSFLNCAAFRTARGESFLTGRSRCDSCGHVLGPLELIPVVSWVLQRGKCRACGAPISIRCPVTELLCSLLTALCLLRFGFTALGLRNYVFLCCLFCLSLVDLDCMLIPDECHVISVLAWLLALPFLRPRPAEILASVLAGLAAGALLLFLSGILDRVLGRESLGGGDVKLVAVTGLYLGPVGTLFCLMLSCVLGLLFQALAGERGRAFPFGPAISAAACLMLLWGEPLVRWYTGLLGF